MFGFCAILAVLKAIEGTRPAAPLKPLILPELSHINKLLPLQNDFTPEEEDEVRKENQWAFE